MLSEYLTLLSDQTSIFSIQTCHSQLGKCIRAVSCPLNLRSALLHRCFPSPCNQGISRITPVSGPAEAAGTQVTFFGQGFVNTTLLACRFGYAPPVPAAFISPNEISCESPPLVYAQSGTGLINTAEEGRTSGLDWSSLSEIRQRYADPLTGSIQLFPGAHYYPLFSQRAVGVEVSMSTFEGLVVFTEYRYDSCVYGPGLPDNDVIGSAAAG